MNEQTDEFARQAGCYQTCRSDPDYPAGNGWIINQETLAKFADSLVQECINEIHCSLSCHGSSYYTDKVAERIEKHFELSEKYE